MIGRVYSIESFGAVDGPDIHVIIFLGGCPVRCLYYHNPDTWDPKDGSPMAAEKILNQYEQTRPFYKRGGITVNGGEPLMQIDFVTELFEKIRKDGIHTYLDASGITFNPGSQTVMTRFGRLLTSTDLILLDIKHIDPKEHVELCAQPQSNTLAFAVHPEKEQIPVWIRHIVVPGTTDWEEYLYRLGCYLGTFKNVRALDVLPYHDMGKAKYDQLEIPYPLEDTASLPPVEAAESCEIILQGTCDGKVHCS